MISVITPTYNCGKYLIRSYECLNNQTFIEWEWILVNDGSEDDTDFTAREIAKKDPRVKYFSLNKNKGRGYARNYAIEKSNGSIITVWDIDDFYTSNRLDEISKAINLGYDYFCSYALIIDNNFNLKGARHFYTSDIRFTPSFVHPTLAFRSSLKNSVKYSQSMKAGEDLGVMINLENNYRGYYCPLYLLIYSEDREVNLKKAIDANISQYNATLTAISLSIINITLKDRIKFVVTKRLKIFLLKAMKLKPKIYLKTIKYRNYNYINSSRLRQEHLDILRGNSCE